MNYLKRYCRAHTNFGSRFPLLPLPKREVETLQSGLIWQLRSLVDTLQIILHKFINLTYLPISSHLGEKILKNHYIVLNNFVTEESPT